MRRIRVGVNKKDEAIAKGELYSLEEVYSELELSQNYFYKRF